jgi:CheY-like chemotaxis protein
LIKTVTEKNEGRPADQERGVIESQPSVFASIREYTARLKATRGRALRVLIVDDEDAIRRFVDRVLSDAGYETTTASDGPEAMRLAQQLQPLDLLVTDVMMPQMTGDELARRMRQADPGLKVLYLTAYSDKLFGEKSTLWQDEAFLDKPCSVKGLIEAVLLLTSGRLELPKS